MNGSDDQRAIYRMMLAAAVAVCLLLALVILAFEMLQKQHESMISSVMSTEQNEITGENTDSETMAELEGTSDNGENDSTADAKGSEASTDSEVLFEIEESESVSDNEEIEEISNQSDSELVIISSGGRVNTDTDNIVYLIKGADKGSNKYERVDRLAYTDSVKYTEEDLQYLDSYGLRITRNEIYARHGRMFNDQDVQDYFNRQDWYVAQTASNLFDESCLNEVEQYNAKLIRSYELKQGY